MVSLRRLRRYAHNNEQTTSRSQRCLSVVRTPLTRIMFWHYINSIPAHLHQRYNMLMLRQISESASYHPHNSLFRLSSPAVPGTMIPHCHIQPRYLILWSGVPSLSWRNIQERTFVHLYSLSAYLPSFLFLEKYPPKVTLPALTRVSSWRKGCTWSTAVASCRSNIRDLCADSGRWSTKHGPCEWQAKVIIRSV